MEWLTAADFGLKLTDSLNSGDPGVSGQPQNLSFDPYAPINIDLSGVGAQRPKSGLLNFSLGDSLDPSTAVGAITTGVIVGVVMLGIVAIAR
jgi:hypothetical protein